MIELLFELGMAGIVSIMVLAAIYFIALK